MKKNEQIICSACGKAIIESKGGYTKAVVTDETTQKVTGVHYKCYHCTLIEVLNALKHGVVQDVTREDLTATIIEMNKRMNGANLHPRNYEKALNAITNIKKDSKMQKVLIDYLNECLVLIKKSSKK